VVLAIELDYGHVRHAEREKERCITGYAKNTEYPLLDTKGRTLAVSILVSARQSECGAPEIVLGPA
jgi:hypothetical protein